MADAVEVYLLCDGAFAAFATGDWLGGGHNSGVCEIRDVDGAGCLAATARRRW